MAKGAIALPSNAAMPLRSPAESAAVSLAATPAPSVPAPLSPMPHRKVLRTWLAPLAAPSTGRALALVALDLLLFTVVMAATVLAPSAALQLLAACAAGVVIARLFILGHDACHQSFTRHRRLNRWLGRLVFLPSLTPYSLWEVGHNVVHHGYTNLRGFDFVWQPLSPTAYRALPRWRRALERVYRSGWAPWLYYLVEIWGARMMWPSRQTMPTRRAAFVRDRLLVTAFAALWVSGLAVAAAATGQSVAWLMAVGFVLPLLVWNGMIGFVVYVHHTHAEVAWYADKPSWSASQPFVSTTVHLTFWSAMGSVLHHIMEHTAHHVDMSVPLYRLKRAQALLEERLPGHIVMQRFSWRWYARTARHCKLYDFERGTWTDFCGRPSRVFDT
jgi:omega-6 fatty acid desaturase (delta-12 desaturase)